MSVSIGDKVKFLNEDMQGVVKELVSATQLVVTTEDGFDYTVGLNEIILVRQDNSHAYQTDVDRIKERIRNKAIVPASSQILDKYKVTSKFQQERVLEVDLHLERLVEFPQKLDDWQKLHTQMQHAKDIMEAVLMDNKVNKVVFIHGVGTGVLKTELLNYLSGFSNLTTKDADFLEYGNGATEVGVKG